MLIRQPTIGRRDAPPDQRSMVKRPLSRDTMKFPAMNPNDGRKNHSPYSADVRPSMVTATCGAPPRKLKNGAEPRPAHSA